MALKKNKWLALIAVTAAYSFAFMVRYIWSPVMSDAGAELGLSTTAMGFYMTIFMAGYLAMQLPGGFLADSLQPKTLLLAMVAICAVCSALLGLSDSYSAGLLLRGLEGLCCGGMYSACSKVVAMYFGPKDRAIPMGILLASPPLGVLLANSLGGPFNEQLGWRVTVASVGWLGAAVAAALFFALEKRSPAAAPVKRAGLLQNARLYFSDAQQLLLAAGGMCLMFGSMGFTTWMNTYMKRQLGYSGTQGGLLLTIYSLSGIAATCISGGLVKRLKLDSKKFLAGCFASSAVIIFLFGFARSYPPLICLAILYGMSANLPSAHLAALAIKRAPENAVATTAALENLIFQVGPMLQSAIVGFAVDATGSYSVMWTIFAAAGVLSLVFILMFQVRAK